MELIPLLIAVGKDLGSPISWGVLFVVVLFASQRYFGDWFKMAREGTANHAEAQARTNTNMLSFIERLNGEIKRLTESEALIMERLADCEKRHRVRDEEVVKLQNEVAALQIKLFNIGLNNQPRFPGNP